MRTLQVGDVVSRDVVTIGSDWLLVDAVKRMHEKRSSYLLVVEDRDPIGIITERDMVGFLQESFEGASWKDMPVVNIMTSPLTTVGEDVTLIEAIAVAHGGRIRHIPVVADDGSIIGVLSQDVIVQTLFQYCQDEGIG